MKKRTAMLIGTAVGVAALAARRVWRDVREESLAGEVALITGGSRGLGLALARELVREGCKIAICARDEAELDRAVADLQSHGANVFSFPCDVTRPEDVQRMVAAVTRHFGRIDLLINNAGVIGVGPVQNMQAEDFELAMNVIFWGTVHCTLAVLPEFLARKAGRIVNINSIGGRVAVPHLLPYSSAKFAVAGFSEGLAAEVASQGVQVCLIHPGLMRTGSHVAALFKGDHRKEAEWFTLGATLPGVSMSARRAARQILSAIKARSTVKVLSLPAKLAARAHDLFPTATIQLAGILAASLLPKAASNYIAQADAAKRGGELVSSMPRGIRILSALGRRAMLRYNQQV